MSSPTRIAHTPARVFSEVVAAIFANPYQRVWGAAGEPPLPVHKVTFRSVAAGMQRASERAIDSGADLRWGADRNGFRTSGASQCVCLVGRWEIRERTEYSGYFAQGSTALIVARYSTCCTETRRGRFRSLSLAGKLFPTADANHATLLRTANFVTQEDIGGARTDYINDAELTNAPDLTVTRRGAGVATLLATGAAFSKVDKEPGIRQLYPISELGKAAGVPTRTPEFMRLKVSPAQPRIAGADLDFRDEVMAQIFDRGDADAAANAVVHDRGDRSGHEQWTAIPHPSIVFELALDRRARLRQRRRLVQRRRRAALQPSDVAERSQRPKDGDTHRREESRELALRLEHLLRAFEEGPCACEHIAAYAAGGRRTR
jgi:hypothetical protein